MFYQKMNIIVCFINGNVTINNGSYDIISEDDGIHADSCVAIKGGNVIINASDDGVYVGGGNDSSGIQGGRDAFDKDNGGLLTINGGGIVHVDGPTKNRFKFTKCYFNKYCYRKWKSNEWIWNDE